MVAKTGYAESEVFHHSLSLESTITYQTTRSGRPISSKGRYTVDRTLGSDTRSEKKYPLSTEFTTIRYHLGYYEDVIEMLLRWSTNFKL